MDKKFLSELKDLIENEIMEADKDCFRRRSVLMDLLKKIEKEKEVAGIV
jgi:hypothetical protein